ncbi:type I polyketide synthase [Micromonospora sp. NBC_01813]|uniref:type I polyketide synthase n=1 Tax=Micromonospora sp. NBC_01813 TaxID=2975988 RepID=UPI002DD9E0EF|nr:type I polyketide synthase [Micromonospora sp. NBC_01813]WSA10772.1 type I polyketide synthase [Micromonospora sp. NBC_01813]
MAIVAMACRYPGGADDPEKLWRLIDDGVDAVGPAPGDRGWDDAATTAYRGGFLRDVAGFDAAFFGIAPHEAAAMDPQQRLLLELAWEAFERARIAPHRMRGTDTGVFVGISPNGYAGQLDRPPAGFEGHLLTGTAPAVASGRLAYVLDLRGPVISVDTACSSSLVALHLAAGAVQRGECRIALAGGATVLATPGVFTEFATQGGLSPDGRCRSFSADADGTGWAEGAGILLLERFDDARRAGHPILAVVRGSAINADGASNGLTAPSGPAQQRLLRAALSAAALEPDEIDVVEAHGTGTVLGDPIEARALQAVFGRARALSDPLWVRSVKSAIGHTQAAAGVAGVIATVEAMRHGRLPRSLHLTEPSPHVDWSGVVPLSQGRSWPAGPRIRRAGVSSFGISGTNAHVIIEEAPRQPTVDRNIPSDHVLAWPVSGHTITALHDQAAALHRSVHTENPGGVASTLTTGRTAQIRRAVVVGPPASLRGGLAAISGQAAAPTGATVVRGEGEAAPYIVLLFPGQGAQRGGAGAALYRRFPAFTAALDAVGEQFARHLDRPLLPLLFAEPGSAEAAMLADTRYAQPALFATGVALYRLLESCGVVPDHLVGHSVGEIAAAHVAGVFDLADACEFVAARGELMSRTAPGAMVAVRASAGQVQDLISGTGLEIAAANAGDVTVVSGPRDAVTEAAARWRQAGIVVSLLPGENAFHSELMEPILSALAEVTGRLTYRQAELEIVSTLTGGPCGDAMGGADYWIEQARRPVRFDDAVASLAGLGVNTYVELGPTPVLTQLLRNRSDLPESASCAALLVPGCPEDRSVLEALAGLYVRGVDLEWPSGMVPDETEAADLPTYQFQRQRYWLVPERARSGPPTPVAAHPLLGAPMNVAGTPHRWYARTLHPDGPWYLDQHRLNGARVLPASAAVELALAAATDGPGPRATIADLTVVRPLVIPEGSPVRMQTQVTQSPGCRRIRVFGRSDGETDWTEYAVAVAPNETPGLPDHDPTEGRPRLPPRLRIAQMTELPVEETYRVARLAGIELGPDLRVLRRLWRDGDSAVAQIEAQLRSRPEDEWYRAHPVLLDGCFHTALALAPSPGGTWLPVGVAEVRLLGPLPAVLWCHAWHQVIDDTGDRVLDLAVWSDDDRLVATVTGLRLRRAAQGTLVGLSPARVAALEIGWHEVPEPPVSAGSLSWLATSTDPATVQTWRAQPSRSGSLLVAGLLEEMASSEPPLPASGGLIVHTRYGDQPVPADAVHRATAQQVAVLNRYLANGGVGPVVLCTSGDPDLTECVTGGLARTLAVEYPQVRCVHLELPPGPANLDDIERAADSTEGWRRLALRGGQWHEARLTQRPAAVDTPPVRPDATYLITGGLGGLGIATARWLASHGARHLVLTGRGTGTVADQSAIDSLRAQNVQVEVRSADVADDSAVRLLLAGIRKDLPPLRGVVHAAGVLADAPLAGHDTERIDRVLAPKVRGAWALHQATTADELDFFVLYSSVSATLGTEGQAAYTVANGFLDTLARHRRRLGLPAVSVGWGPWTETGMAWRTDVLARLTEAGLIPLTPAAALSALGGLLHPGDQPASVALAIVDWQRYAAGRGRPDELLANVCARDRPTPSAVTDPPAPADPQILARLAVSDPESARSAVLSVLLDRAAALLRLTSDDLAEARDGFERRRLSQLGADSLITIRLRERLRTDLGVDLAPEHLFGTSTGQLADMICTQLMANDLTGADSENDTENDREVLVL